MRKSVLLIAFIFCFNFNLFSQEESIPSIDFVNTLYSITKDGLVSLEKQEASVKSKLKLGTFITYSSLFAGGTKSSFIIVNANNNK